LRERLRLVAVIMIKSLILLWLAAIEGSWEGRLDLRCESLSIAIGIKLQLKTVRRSKDFFVGVQAQLG
jgi:hypothetical protein